MKQVWLISAEKLCYSREGGAHTIAGQLKVLAGVENIAYEKKVGIRYSIDRFNHFTDVYGQWSRQVNPQVDEFLILSKSDIPVGAVLQFALFYQTGGQTFWDSNEGMFYSVQF
uniref:CBM21 domain-containing protein n=1 Tax=Gracilinema caldarium TaxID=215591 RepID=A0A7C3EBL8_9SPIR